MIFRFKESPNPIVREHPEGKVGLPVPSGSTEMHLGNTGNQ